MSGGERKLSIGILYVKLLKQADPRSHIFLLRRLNLQDECSMFVARN